MQGKRVVRLLFLPFLILMFAIGWLLYVFGETRSDAKTEAKNKSTYQRKVAFGKADNVEMGIIEKLEEAPLSTDKAVR